MQCPISLPSDDKIVMAHGGGGRLTQRLIENVFAPAFALGELHDGAALPLGAERLAFTTDSYVVRPLFFPGGNIGDLAVNGTVNDLAMCGARPLYLSCGFILEEGLPMETLKTIVETMRAAAARAGVSLVTGDTKVVDKGKADGLFINTAGIGILEAGVAIGPKQVQPGDAILISGDLGAHGAAILSVREGLEFESPIETDCAPLWEPVRDLLAAGLDVHCLRDLTRGGLASALNEIAQARRLNLQIREADIPVTEPVRGACEILGLDPAYVANEGRFCAFVPVEQAHQALAILRHYQPMAAIAGVVTHATEGRVEVRSRIGGTRVMDMLSGEQLPRIC